MRGPATQAVANGVRGTHPPAPSPVICILKLLVKRENAAIDVGHDFGAAGDEVVTQHLTTMQIQREPAQVVHRVLALVPESFALAAQLPDGRGPWRGRHRLRLGGLSGLGDIGGRRMLVACVVPDRLGQLVGIHVGQGYRTAQTRPQV